jgi:hypothetical protein
MGAYLDLRRWCTLCATGLMLGGRVCLTAAFWAAAVGMTTALSIGGFRLDVDFLGTEPDLRPEQ